MTRAQFIADPWDQSHPTYAESVFHIRPAPEFATAEVVVASLYRASGFPTCSERLVPAAGRDFDRAFLQPGTHRQTGSKIALETWRTIVHGILESPKRPNQSAKRFLQMCPVVPDVSLYSGSARLSGNSWNPGSLLQRMIQLGSDSCAAAQLLWDSLHSALDVEDHDDIWARWLNEEFVRRRRSDATWTSTPLEPGPDLPDGDKLALRYPSRQFVRDLHAVLGAKCSMTRRQWISLLEATARLGGVAHVLWLCDINANLWRVSKEVIDGAPVPSRDELCNRVLSSTTHFLTYGNPAVAIIRDYASRYLNARIGINLILHALSEYGERLDPLDSIDRIRRMLELVEARRESMNTDGLLQAVAAVRENQARTIACKKGIGSNIVEFITYTLGQRQTADASLRGYDQGYILRKRGEHSSSPWVVSLGPVAILALVHCCLRDAVGPRSVHRLCQHLQWYGIEVDRDDIEASELGRKLRMLGLVLDSPDAESGMLLVPPFGTIRRNSEVAAS